MRRREGRAGGGSRRHVLSKRRGGGVRRRRPADHPTERDASTSPTWPCHVMARRRPWRQRPTSARSSGTESSSAPRIRTWSCSRRRSARPSQHCTDRCCGTPFTRPEMCGPRSSAGSAPLGARPSGRLGRHVAIRTGSGPGRRRSAFLSARSRSTHGTCHPPGRTRSGPISPAPFSSIRRPDQGSPADAEPSFRPEAEFEVAGFVPNVVFPTGLVQEGKRSSSTTGCRCGHGRRGASG